MDRKLVEQLMTAFNAKLDSDDEIDSLINSLNEHRSTYADADRYAEHIGELLNETMQSYLTPEVLQSEGMQIGDMVHTALPIAHEDIANYTKETQSSLNHRSGLHIKGLDIPLNEERLNGLIKYLSNYEVIDEETLNVLAQKQTTFLKSIITDSIERNVAFHYDIGLQPRIIRRYFGGCDWCKKLAGEYTYPDNVPDDVYKRHNNCHCIVEYFPGNGRRQDVWTKKWKSEHTDEIKQRIELSKELEDPYQFKSAQQIGRERQLKQEWEDYYKHK